MAKELTHVDIINIYHRNPKATFLSAGGAEFTAAEVQEMLLANTHAGGDPAEFAKQFTLLSYNGGKDDKSIPQAQRKGGF